MAEAKLYGQNKGGMSINGIIKDYYAYAGENISAGDLVEYINGVAGKMDYGESVDTKLSTNKLSGTDMKAVAIDNNRVFIAYTVEGSSSGYTSLYGMVCTIKGATIQKGNGVQLCTGDYSGSWISAIKLDNKRIFVTHANDGTDSCLYGLICVINDTTIATIGTDTQLSTSPRSAQENSPCLLPNGNVFIAHRYGGSTSKLYGMILSINNTEIKVETDTQLLSSDYISNNISTCLLPNGNVFITHSYGSSYYIYGIVCKINNDNTIDKGTDTAIITSSNAALYMESCGLSNGNIFIAYRYSTTYQLRGIVCSVSDTTITVGTYTSLSTIERASYEISLCTLPNDNVLILHSYTADYHLYGMICGINGTSIIKGNDTALITVEDSGENISSTTLLNGTIFVAHQSDSNQCLNAQIFGIDYENNIPTNHIIATEYETQIRKVTTGQFDGIAKTSGEGSPEFVEGEVTKAGNIFPTSWNAVSTTEYTANDGTALTSSSTIITSTLNKLYYVSDNSVSERWKSEPVERAGNSHWAKMNLLNPVKITKFLTYITHSEQGDFIEAIIQGSNDDNEWIDLHTISSAQTELTEITLTNPDYYKYYRIYGTVTGTLNCLEIYEWQTSEYIEKGLVPSTGHKDIVSIWTLVPIVTQEVTMADGNTLADANGDIFLVREEIA